MRECRRRWFDTFFGSDFQGAFERKLNLTRGFFAYGALIIPLLSFGNYVAQRRRIVVETPFDD